MILSPSLLPPQMPGEASAAPKNHTSSPDATAQLLQIDDRLPLNITFAGLCYQSKDRLSVISDTSGVHPKMPVILL